MQSDKRTLKFNYITAKIALDGVHAAKHRLGDGAAAERADDWSGFDFFSGLAVDGDGAVTIQFA